MIIQDSTLFLHHPFPRFCSWISELVLFLCIGTKMLQFCVLYTKQKTQKSKKWHDGILKYNATNKKGTVYEEGGKVPVDSKFFFKDEPLEVGSVVEMDSCLVEIESILNEDASTKPQDDASKVSNKSLNSSAGSSQGTRSLAKRGLKRKQPPLEERLRNQQLQIEKAAKSKCIEDEPTPANTHSPSFIPNSQKSSEITIEEEVIFPDNGRKDSEILALFTRPKPTAVHTTHYEDSPSLKSHEEEFFEDSDHDMDSEFPCKNEEAIATVAVKIVTDEHGNKKVMVPTNEGTASSVSTLTPIVKNTSIVSSFKAPASLTNNVSFPSTSKMAQSINKLAQASSLFKAASMENDDDDDLPITALVGQGKNNTATLKKIWSQHSLPKASHQLVHKSNGKGNLHTPLKSNQPVNQQNTAFLAWSKHEKINFPDKRLCDFVRVKYGKIPMRATTIPDVFPNVLEYKRRWRSAILEDLNLLLLQLAADLHDYLPLATGVVKEIWCNNHKKAAVLRTVMKESNNKGRKFYACPVEKCKTFVWADQAAKDKVAPRTLDDHAIKFLRSKGFHIDHKCELIRTFVQGKKTEMSNIYLKLSWQENASSYSQDDLWVLSSDATFSPMDNNLFLLARSLFHGPAKSGMLEICLLEEDKSLLERIGQSQKVYALRGPNIKTQLAMIDGLNELSESNFPLLPKICKGPNEPVAHQPQEDLFKLILSQEELDSTARAVVEEYRLNEDQARVLEHCKSWFETRNGKRSAEPALLVHGVFGSGKSYLLVVLIIFLSKILDAAKVNDAHILVCSCTNTAVDRVLLGLLEQDYTEFVRVGSLKKIAKPILNYTLQSSETKEALRELQSMLKESLTHQEQKVVMKNIQDLQSGRMKKREAKLKQTRVLGVTCAASVFPILQDCKFPIVLLDECSQMLEPLSLLPLGRFGCVRLLAVGDPMQLPPTMLSNEEKAHEDKGLSKTLFIRLASIGFQPIPLRTQYRCHPSISKIANTLFYSNQLLDGVSQEERAPLLCNVPTLLFCNDDRGEEVRDRFGSFYNSFEAQTISEIIKILLQSGVEGNQIGVIALYKAQVFHINSLLKQTKIEVPQSSTENMEEEMPTDVDDHVISQDIQVSTVDAFQGAEKDIIILACSRTSKVGFSDSPKRLTVALTRAKRHLFIIGNPQTLCTVPIWKEIYNYAKSFTGGIQQCSTIVQTKQFSLAPISTSPSSTTTHGATQEQDWLADLEDIAYPADDAAILQEDEDEAIFHELVLDFEDVNENDLV